MRFLTHFTEVYHRALAERLALVAGRTLEQPVTDPASFYADKIRELLHELGVRQIRTLVVLDGLDETIHGDFDAALFPRVLPESLRVLVSARLQLGDADSGGWLDRLEWRDARVSESLELPTLSTVAVQHVLASLSERLVPVAEDTALMQRLVELTEGEPLLVKLYADDLLALAQSGRPITLEAMSAIKPGFEAYFENWLTVQRRTWQEAGRPIDEASEGAVLAMLALALGPLEGNQLLELCARLPAVRPVLMSEHLLAPFRRFVIGDGSRDNGYVLSHPRIAEYLRQKPKVREIASKVQRAFVDWGQALVSSFNAQPDEVQEPPTYALHYHRLHMQAAKVSIRQFEPLLHDGWRRAWERSDDGVRGFDAEVRAVLKLARAAGPSQIDLQLRCVLILSSILSLGQVVREDLVLAAVRHGMMSVPQAAHLARCMRSPVAQAHTLAMLARHFEVEPEARAMLLAEALAGARKLTETFTKTLALTRIAVQLEDAHKQEVIREALSVALRHRRHDGRIELLTTLAPLLAADDRPMLLAQ